MEAKGNSGFTRPGDKYYQPVSAVEKVQCSYMYLHFLKWRL
jgi:hypothetical protein